MTNTALKLPTYEDIMNLPDGMTGEILAGELYASPRPSSKHQHAITTISVPLAGKYGRKSGAGPADWIFLTEPEIHLGGHVIVPDVAGWKVSDLPEAIVKVFGDSHVSVKPNWICEILSPNSARREGFY